MRRRSLARNVDASWQVHVLTVLAYLCAEQYRRARHGVASTLLHVLTHYHCSDHFFERVCVCVFALLAVMHVRTLGEQSQCCSHAGCEHESVDLSHWVAAMVVMMTRMNSSIMLWL